MLLKDKTAIITGGSRGIGAATAKLFARHGARVGVNYNRSDKAARRVVEEIRNSGGEALAVRADVTDRKQVERMVETVREVFGAIDILVGNAGIKFTIAPFTDHAWDDFESKLLGEIRAAFFCAKAVMPEMIERKSGSIVMVSSGLSRQPGMGFSSHSTAKSALNAFVRALALELGPYGIRVNTVSPGLTLTDATTWMTEERKKHAAQSTPLQRNGLPEDIAGAILMMASDETRFITGSYLPVNGGTHMP